MRLGNELREENESVGEGTDARALEDESTDVDGFLDANAADEG